MKDSYNNNLEELNGIKIKFEKTKNEFKTTKD